LTSGRSEQGKLPVAKAFTLAERDKHMSEEKSSFMQQLDAWTEATVIVPLTDPKHQDSLGVVVGEIKKAIRHKVLESYHNGQAAAGAKSQPKSFRPRGQSSK
jgi:hypothetical protein